MSKIEQAIAALDRLTLADLDAADAATLRRLDETCNWCDLATQRRDQLVNPRQA
jgi:hypothetical protein